MFLIHQICVSNWNTHLLCEYQICFYANMHIWWMKCTFVSLLKCTFDEWKSNFCFYWNTHLINKNQICVSTEIHIWWMKIKFVSLLNYTFEEWKSNLYLQLQYTFDKWKSNLHLCWNVHLMNVYQIEKANVYIMLNANVMFKTHIKNVQTHTGNANVLPK